MDSSSLEKLVTTEAKTKASSLIATAEHDALQFIEKEKSRLEKLHSEQKQKLIAEYESRKSFLLFTMESDFKKKLLQNKQSYMDQLSHILIKNLREMIRLKPTMLLKNTIAHLSTLDGKLYVSEDLSGIITKELIQEFNQANKGHFEYIGKDSELESGIAVLRGSTRYIFSLQEFVDSFMDKNLPDISKLIQI